MKQYSEEELRLLTQVLPNVALQLRGAMANVYTAAQRLSPPEAREENAQTDALASVFSQSFYQMYRTVSNLTDAGKLAETGKLTLFNDDIAGLCRTVCAKAEEPFLSAGVELRFFPERESLIIGMDTESIEKMLLNLLSNALKFTPRGGRVSVRLRADEKFVRLSVTDNGCGIARERLDTIFDGFLNVERYDPAPHGLGLGLALCRRTAQGHGGMIAVESEEGRGSVFTVSLPNVRSVNGRMGERKMDYAGGFNPVLMQLSDALHPEAFAQKYLD